MDKVYLVASRVFGKSLTGFNVKKDDNKHIEAILHLIKEGDAHRLQQHFQSTDASYVDYHGKNLAFYACYWGQPECLLYLFMRGVSVNTVTPAKQNLFHVCAYRGQIECVKVIFQRLYQLRLMEIHNELRDLLKKHDVRKSDYKNGKLAIVTSKPEKFQHFRQDCIILLKKYFDIEMDDYLVALQLQYYSSGQTPLHFATLNLFQKSNRVLRRLLRYFDETCNYYNFYHYLWERCNLYLYQSEVDPRCSRYCLHELKYALGYHEFEDIKKQSYQNFRKYIGKIMAVIDKKNDSVLHMTVKAGNEKLTDLLVRNGASTDMIPEDLKKKGREFIKSAPIYAVSQKGGQNLTNLFKLLPEEVNLKQNIYGDTPLHKSMVVGGIEPAKKLISSGAQLDIQDVNGWTPLHKACYKGNIYMVQLLISKGSSLKSKTNKGYTALHLAAMENHYRIVYILLNYIDPNVKNEELCTPLHLASKKGAEKAALKLLYNYKCDLYAVDVKKWTALHYASFSKQPAVIRLLLRYDDDGRLESMRNCNGKMAKQLCQDPESLEAYRNVWKAARYGNINELKKLALLGYELDKVTPKTKKSALMLAAINRHYDVVKYLLYRGVDTYGEDADGKSVEYLLKSSIQKAKYSGDNAQRRQYQAIEKLLSNS